MLQWVVVRRDRLLAKANKNERRDEGSLTKDDRFSAYCESAEIARRRPVTTHDDQSPIVARPRKIRYALRFKVMNMNMKSNEKDESNVKIEIQKALISIYNLTTNIKRELELINDYTSKGGQLRKAVLQANETLITAAREANIDVNNVLCGDQNENQGDRETRFDSRNGLSSAMLENKVLSLLNDV